LRHCSDVCFTECMLSKVIFKVSCWLGQDMENRTLTSLGQSVAMYCP